MRLKFFYLISIVCIASACWNNEEEWRENLNGTGSNASIEDIENCSNAIYEDWTQSEYNLPYPVGDSYVIGLAHCSDSYHSPGLPDQFAIDFNMPIGSKITASRAGVVVNIEESGLDGGFPNNYVLLRHSDNTYGWYMHLTNNGAEVTIGQSVPKGGLIGYSGNTGLAGYPHLHLVFTYENSWPYSSFPTTFKNTIENKKSLESGVLYTAE